MSDEKKDSQLNVAFNEKNRIDRDASIEGCERNGPFVFDLYSTRKNLAQALAKAQGQIKTPLKNQTVSMKFQDKQGNWKEKSYSYADLSGVIDAIRGPLSENGLCLFHKMGYCKGPFGLTTTLMHSSGESIDTWYPLPDPAKGVIKAQDFGSALTYGRRYSVSSLIGIASEDDDDGQGAAPTEPPKQQGARQNQSKNQTPPQQKKELKNHAPGAQQRPPPPKPEDVPQQFPDYDSGQPQGHTDVFDFIMPFGSSAVKGKKLRHIAHDKLIEIGQWIDQQTAKTEPPANLDELFKVRESITKVLQNSKMQKMEG